MTYTLEQQKANRKLWIEALRSGKYKQAKGALRKRHGYCCLGVLASLAGHQFIWNRDIQQYRTQCGITSFAPDEAVAFVGLNTCGGDFGDKALTALNDSGTSFAKIADIIESEPPGLFAESFVESVE